MKIKAAPVKVKNLIQQNPGFYYQIPKYQREYIWGKNQITELYNDLVENDKGLFIGPIIFITSPSQVREVIDGQQRLTTLCLMLGVLYDKISQLPKATKRSVNVLNNIKDSLRNPNNPINQLILVPQCQNNNDVDFNYAIFSLLQHQLTEPLYYGNRRIGRAVKVLSKLIEDDLASCKPKNKEKKLKEVYDKVQAAELVKIEAKNHYDAYMLFESLNNRGVPLTAIELMKNKMMSETDKNNGDIIANDGRWKYILELLSDDDSSDNYKVQERFFRHHYNAFITDIRKHYPKINNLSKVSIATRSNLLNIYETLIDTDVNQFLNDITESAEIYQQLILPEKCTIQKWQVPLLDLQHVQAAPSYMLLLYLVKKQKTLNLNDKTIVDIIELLVKFFIRRNLTDTPNTRELDRMFMGIINDIETQVPQRQKVYELIKNELASVSADINRFIEALMGKIYDENRDGTRFVLCKLAENGFAKKIVKDLWDRDKKGNYIWTIEHVFPEGDNIPEEWIVMMTGNKTKVAEAKKIQKDYVHRLGNLTLTGYNSSLGNKSFNTKKNHIDAHGNFIGYRNGIINNDDIVKAKKWNKDNIKRRTVALVKEAIDKFLFPWEQKPTNISFPKIP